MSRVETIYGVDFSAATDNAGKKTWITKAEYTDDVLTIRTVAAATDFLSCTADRESTLRHLRERIADDGPTAAYGLDFPFSLPAVLLVEDEWLTFLERFPSHFSGPDEFRATCHRWTQLIDAGSKEIQRDCEEEYGGLCAYNLWIHKMTYYGIQDLLRPLRLTESVRVLPFDGESEDGPVVVETYPAATLQELELDQESYKGGSGRRNLREELLGNIRAVEDVHLELDEDDADRITADEGGDALDSVLAALGVYRGLEGSPESPDEYADRPDVEGHIYA